MSLKTRARARLRPPAIAGKRASVSSLIGKSVSGSGTLLPKIFLFLCDLAEGRAYKASTVWKEADRQAAVAQPIDPSQFAGLLVGGKLNLLERNIASMKEIAESVRSRGTQRS
jgi:hypothetical protein